MIKLFLLGLSFLTNFTPTSGIVFTQNHGFSVGAEVEFQGTDSAEMVVNIPFPITTLQVTGGNINYNVHGRDGASVALFRFAIMGDPAGGDAGAGPGSVLVVNRAIYVFHGEAGHETIAPFTLNMSPAPTGSAPYQFKMHVDAAGAVWPAHVEIALSGIWSDTPQIGFRR